LRIKAAADANGTILTFNHQRRFLVPFHAAKRIIDAGEIGDLTSIEATCGDLTDWGTHWLDMMFYFNNEVPAAWVIGQIHNTEERRTFGALTEQQAICHFAFQNGVRATLITGDNATIGGPAIRVIGTLGAIDILWEKPWIRYRTKGDPDWRYIESEESIHGNCAIDRACADLVAALDTPGYRPLLTVDHAIQHTEVIFATFESSRRRGRVDLPLDKYDSALITMTEQNWIGPNAN